MQGHRLYEITTTKSFEELVHLLLVSSNVEHVCLGLLALTSLLPSIVDNLAPVVPVLCLICKRMVCWPQAYPHFHLLPPLSIDSKEDLASKPRVKKRSGKQEKPRMFWRQKSLEKQGVKTLRNMIESLVFVFQVFRQKCLQC